MPLTTALILSFLVASISFLISESNIFFNIRLWAAMKDEWLGNLFSCGYCVGHWVSFVVVGTYRAMVFKLSGASPMSPFEWLYWMGEFGAWILIVAWLAGLQWAIMSKLTEDK